MKAMTTKDASTKTRARGLTTSELTEIVGQLKEAILVLTEENDTLRRQLDTLTNRVDTLDTWRTQSTATRVASSNGYNKGNNTPQRPPSEGGWVKAIGKPGERVECPNHGSIVLNKFGCCYHCFNEAHKARAVYKSSVKNGVAQEQGELELHIVG